MYRENYSTLRVERDAGVATTGETDAVPYLVEFVKIRADWC